MAKLRSLARKSLSDSCVSLASETTATGSVLQKKPAMRDQPRDGGSVPLERPSTPQPTWDDRLIKQKLKQLKKLELALGKFAAKHTGLTKANVLRTSLLPFLRLLPDLAHFFPRDAKIYASFASITTAILGEWWRLLLAALVAQGSQVSASDRSAYLECILRILARPEWLSCDADALETYRLGLVDTLDFCIAKLQTMKVVPIFMSAFVGKVFAYAFFYLPEVCNALLFLLNVKQATVDALVADLASPLAPDIAKAKAAFPLATVHLVNYRGLVSLEKAKRNAINSIPPPKHPVKGIRDPGGAWVRRWCNSDSDIFISFFRHYVTIVNTCMAGQDIPLSLFPGFNIVASHVFQVFRVSINRILTNINKPGTLATDGKKTLSQKNTDDRSVPVPGFPYKTNDSNYTSIIKLFKISRDIDYSSISFSASLNAYFDSLLAKIARSISIFDFNKNGLLLNLVYEFSNHVIDTSNINWEFWLGCSYMMLSSTHHVQVISRNFAFLFNVWDRIPNAFSNCESPECIAHLKGWLLNQDLSYKLNFSNWLTSTDSWLEFFTHWSPIVRSHYFRLLVWRVIGINNYENSYTLQTTKRVKAKVNFIYDGIQRIVTSQDSSSPLANLDFSACLPMTNRKFGIIPMNSKISYMEDIVALNASAIPKASDLRKTHPYEIFDEAIYTCTSLPSSPAQYTNGGAASPLSPNSPRNHSLIGLLSKIFKLLSTDDSLDNSAFAMTPPNKIHSERKENTPVLKNKRNSKSLSSLASAFSAKSRGSAPSFMSFKSTPNSINDLSTESSTTSDSDSSSLLSDCLGSSISSTQSPPSSVDHQPPELFKVPPEISRPLFKFDIVIDHETTSEKYQMMQTANSSQYSSRFFPVKNQENLSLLTMPREPKVPSVSIYLNSDLYNKFYITNENFSMDDDMLCEEDVEDLQRFTKEFLKNMRSPSRLVSLGKALNEWNDAVDEFEYYLFHKVEADQASYLPSEDEEASVLVDEQSYFLRIIPFLPIDNLTEVKLLNAA